MDKFSKFFKDRYGIDRFSKFLFFLGAILILSLNKYIFILGFITAAYSAFRCLSKNKYKRYSELRSFDNFMLIIRQRFYGIKYKIDEKRKYKVFKCPKCSQKLRVPRKKGNITITCKKCHTEFKGKS